MNAKLDWSQERAYRVSLLEKQSGQGVDVWRQRIEQEGLHDEDSLRTWLAAQGVTGYAQSILVMECFGYPDYFTTTADQLIEAQYEDRSHLLPIYLAIVEVAQSLGATVQARKTYVSLLTPRRTFARLRPTTKQRLDLGLRLPGQKPGGRLQPSSLNPTMKLQISFTTREEVDAEALDWLQRAYVENC